MSLRKSWIKRLAGNSDTIYSVAIASDSSVYICGTAIGDFDGLPVSGETDGLLLSTIAMAQKHGPISLAQLPVKLRIK